MYAVTLQQKRKVGFICMVRNYTQHVVRAFGLTKKQNKSFNLHFSSSVQTHESGTGKVMVHLSCQSETIFILINYTSMFRDGHNKQLNDD